MTRQVNVALNWTRIDWHPGDTWKKVTLPRLIDAGLNPKLIDRSVYVIRLNGDFAVSYPRGETPTVYIGEGNFSSRIHSHRSWVSEIRDLVGEFSFQVCVATPRVRNREFAYRDTEAALLDRFAERFNSAPLWNKQFEKRLCPHYVYSQKQLDTVLGKRSGARYKWALRPLRSSPFFQSYEKTHFEWAG